MRERPDVPASRRRAYFHDLPTVRGRPDVSREKTASVAFEVGTGRAGGNVALPTSFRGKLSFHGESAGPPKTARTASFAIVGPTTKTRHEPSQCKRTKWQTVTYRLHSRHNESQNQAIIVMVTRRLPLPTATQSRTRRPTRQRNQRKTRRKRPSRKFCLPGCSGNRTRPDNVGPAVSEELLRAWLGLRGVRWCPAASLHSRLSPTAPRPPCRR